MFLVCEQFVSLFCMPERSCLFLVFCNLILMSADKDFFLFIMLEICVLSKSEHCIFIHFGKLSTIISWNIFLFQSLFSHSIIHKDKQISSFYSYVFYQTDFLHLFDWLYYTSSYLFSGSKILSLSGISQLFKFSEFPIAGITFFYLVCVFSSVFDMF